MKKITISLNSLIHKLLAQSPMSTSQNWLEECFSLMDQAEADSHNVKWNREELYDIVI